MLCNAESGYICTSAVWKIWTIYNTFVKLFNKMIHCICMGVSTILMGVSTVLMGVSTVLMGVSTVLMGVSTVLVGQWESAGKVLMKSMKHPPSHTINFVVFSDFPSF